LLGFLFLLLLLVLLFGGLGLQRGVCTSEAAFLRRVGDNVERRTTGLGSTPADSQPHLLWFAGGMSLVLLVAALFVALNRQAPLALGAPLDPSAAEGLVEVTRALPDRTSCTEIGRSDLRSPAEGLWVQRNCVAPAQLPSTASVTVCNRTSLDPGEFTEVAPGLHVFRHPSAGQLYLWYASAEGCFDLVSDRVVTAVCRDQSVTFSWSASACSAHGGVLALVNGHR
jgi:hypothetical protein